VHRVLLRSLPHSSTTRRTAARSIGFSYRGIRRRAARRLRGARRTVGTVAFGCAAGRTEVVELIVGSRLRRLLRRYGRRGLGLAASILTAGDGTVSSSTASLRLAPTRAQRSRNGGGSGAG